MFWNSKQKKGIVVLQEVLQDENDVFDILIIALEKLESVLLQEKNLVLDKTAIGSERDLSSVIRFLDEGIEKIKLHCISLNICSSYDDKDVFKMAAKMFMQDLFEWYAGRAELNFFDEVDAAVIPILESLVDSDQDKILSDFETYVYKPSNNIEETLDEKYTKVKSGFDAWIKAQHYFGQRQSQEKPGEKKQIFSHKRGEAVDGYIRVMKALTTMNTTSAPAKLLLQMVNEYLPEIVGAVPHINEEFIDGYFEKKAQTTEKDFSVTKIEKEGVLYYQLFITDPTHSIESSQPIIWKHLNENCEGNIYIGDNGCFYCEKCGVEIEVSRCSFHPDGFIEFDTESNYELKSVAKAIATSNLYVEVELEWMQQVMASLAAQSSDLNKAIDQLYPLLYEKIKEILDAHNIKYSEVKIEVK